MGFCASTAVPQPSSSVAGLPESAGIAMHPQFAVSPSSFSEHIAMSHRALGTTHSIETLVSSRIARNFVSSSVVSVVDPSALTDALRSAVGGRPPLATGRLLSLRRLPRTTAAASKLDAATATTGPRVRDRRCPDVRDANKGDAAVDANKGDAAVGDAIALSLAHRRPKY